MRNGCVPKRRRWHFLWKGEKDIERKITVRRHRENNRTLNTNVAKISEEENFPSEVKAKGR